jgi:hypothetical protein
MTPRDPNDPNARALAIADGVLEAGGWGLRARGCALAADGEGVGGVGVQGQTTPGYSYGRGRKKFLIFCK